MFRFHSSCRPSFRFRFQQIVKSLVLESQSSTSFVRATVLENVKRLAFFHTIRGTNSDLLRHVSKSEACHLHEHCHVAAERLPLRGPRGTSSPATIKVDYFHIISHLSAGRHVDLDLPAPPCLTGLVGQCGVNATWRQSTSATWQSAPASRRSYAVKADAENASSQKSSQKNVDSFTPQIFGTSGQLLEAPNGVGQTGGGGMDSSGSVEIGSAEERSADVSAVGGSDISKPVVLYRGRWMQLFRIIVRLKVIQLVGVAALALPIAQYTQHGSLPGGTLLAVGAVVGGAGAASVALWYYSSRYVGELALMPPDGKRVRISVLDFWGRREDLIFATKDVVPPLKGLNAAELAGVARDVFVPLDVVGDRQFVLSLKHGRQIDKQRLINLLHGK